MRIKLDENIPVSLVTALDALGHDAETKFQTCGADASYLRPR